MTAKLFLSQILPEASLKCKFPFSAFCHFIHYAGHSRLIIKVRRNLYMYASHKIVYYGYLFRKLLNEDCFIYSIDAQTDQSRRMPRLI